MDRSTIYEWLVSRWHWLGKGTWLYCLLWPKQWLHQRKLDRERIARFEAFKASVLKRNKANV